MRRKSVLTRCAVVAATGLALLAITSTAPALAAPPPPPDAAALTAAISGLPNATVTGALVQLRGSSGSWTGTSGVADLDTGAPVSADGHFRIGSITKTFTAVVVLQLAAEHRIALDQPVQRYLPGVLPADYPPITVSELLDHTSGLPDVDLPSDPQWIVDHRYTVFTPAQILATATAHPMMFPPGTAQHYGNTNYIVSGLLVQKVTGRSFGQEVTDRVLRPLGLRDTSVPGNADPHLPAPYAHGYLAVNGDLVDMTSMSQSIPWAAGDMISTAPDLTRFITALFQGKLLPPKELATMFALPDVTVFGSDQPAYLSAGLETGTFNGVTFWGKSGSRYGYEDGMFATRDLTRTLVYSVNSTSKGDDQPTATTQQIIAAATD